MSEATNLFDDEEGAETMSDEARHRTGTLPAHVLRAFVGEHEIQALEPIEAGQIQPSSLDLRLGPIGYRIRAGFLPGPEGIVAERLKEVVMHEIDLTRGAVLERGCVYLVPLMESLALPQRVSGIASPKSSTGRLDVFTRLMCDHSTAFDQVPAAYRGPLYAEISPRTFSVLVRAGTRLNQLRIRRGTHSVSDTALRRLAEEEPIIDGPIDIDGGIALRVDLSGASGGGLIGYRAKHHADLIDVDRVDFYDPREYWEPLQAPGSSTLVLDPDEFYILATKEAVQIPAAYAAEMVPYNPLIGEFRVHYAGFFDPGFGHQSEGAAGTRAVLEVRSHDVPFVLEDGQIVGRLQFERLTERPEQVYGAGMKSHYQSQGLKLSKHFKEWPA